MDGIKPRQFDLSFVEAADDASVYASIFGNRSGVLPNRGNVCNIYKNDGLLRLDTGEIIICGRSIKIENPIDLEITRNDFGKYVILEIDLNKENTYSGDIGTPGYTPIINQVDFKLSMTYVQEDLNNNGKLFQLPLAQIRNYQGQWIPNKINASYLEVLIYDQSERDYILEHTRWASLISGNGADVAFWRSLKPGLYWNHQTITNLPFIKTSNYGLIEIKKYNQGLGEYLITYTQGSSVVEWKGNVLVAHINDATTNMVWKRLNEVSVTLYDNSTGLNEGDGLIMPSGYTIADFEKFIITTANGYVIEKYNSTLSYILLLELLRYNGEFSYYLEIWLYKSNSTTFNIERSRYSNHRHASTGAYHNIYESDTKRIIRIKGILKSLY